MSVNIQMSNTPSNTDWKPCNERDAKVIAQNNGKRIIIGGIPAIVGHNSWVDSNGVQNQVMLDFASDSSSIEVATKDCSAIIEEIFPEYMSKTSV